MCNRVIYLPFLLIGHLIVVIVAQSTPCDLPDGRKSICVKYRDCAYFQEKVMLYKGRPPKALIDEIKNHTCTSVLGSACCPDNAVALLPPSRLSMRIVDYEALKNHANVHLINSNRCGRMTSKRIVGGKNATINEIPWIALLGYKSALDDQVAWQCGGALISLRYVLTASHCHMRTLSLVRLGEHVISTDQDCDNEECADEIQDIPIEKFIKHPQFDRINKRNDIALIRLSSDAEITHSNIETICLPITQKSEIGKVSFTKDLPLTISGFGRIGNGVQSDVLQKAYVPFVTNDDCVKIYQSENIPIHPEYLCAGGRNKTDTCKGDSGGPIFGVGGGQGRIMLYGTVIGGVDCGNANLIFPGIYSDIRFYLKWILDNLEP